MDCQEIIFNPIDNTTGRLNMKKITLIWLLFFLSLVIASAGIAQSYGIPKTGQTDIYHGPAENDPGDDGTVQAGFPLAGARGLAFHDNDNETIQIGRASCRERV